MWELVRRIALRVVAGWVEWADFGQLYICRWLPAPHIPGWVPKGMRRWEARQYGVADSVAENNEASKG